MFPLRSIRSRVGPMNRRLSDAQIRTTCRELLAHDSNVTGRQLRRELQSRFGAVGKTARVFELWREETHVLKESLHAAALPANVAELQRRLKAAEATAADNLKRAELAEYRERAHQEHWALEIDRVKRELEQAQSSVDGAVGRGSRPFRV
jgi:2-polyprenyl-3-methyl-5-hydroxy-6-metoxy-1,4-benzoquinol methylase